jgi:hypothetical protein
MMDVDVVNLTSNSPEGGGGGGKTRLFKKKYSDFYSMCPYREYRALAKRAPRGSITLLTLYSHLKPLGASMCQIGAAMFELDTEGVGYLRWDADKRTEDDAAVRDRMVDVLSRCCTRLSPDDISMAVSRIRQQAQQETSRQLACIDASKKASSSAGAASSLYKKGVDNDPFTSPRGSFLSRRLAIIRDFVRFKA